MKNTYPPRNQFNTFMIVQASGINARINRLAHSFCSKPLAEINGIFQREVEKEGEPSTYRERMELPDRE